MEAPRTKLESILFWGARALAILIPAIISAYISYREASSESTETKQHASAGYDVLVSAVDRLAEKVVEQGQEISYLKGRLESMEAARTRATSSRTGGSGAARIALSEGRVEAPEAVPAPAPPAPPEPAAPTPPNEKTIFRSPIPRSLKGAYQMQQDRAINF